MNTCIHTGCDDCQPDDDVLCYTEYDCRNWLSPNEEQCIWNPLIEEYQCFYRKDLPEWRCDMCEKDTDDPGVPHMEPSEKCT